MSPIRFELRCFRALLSAVGLIALVSLAHAALPNGLQAVKTPGYGTTGSPASLVDTGGFFTVVGAGSGDGTGSGSGPHNGQMRLTVDSVSAYYHGAGGAENYTDGGTYTFTVAAKNPNLTSFQLTGISYGGIRSGISYNAISVVGTDTNNNPVTLLSGGTATGATTMNPTLSNTTSQLKSFVLTITLGSGTSCTEFNFYSFTIANAQAGASMPVVTTTAASSATSTSATLGGNVTNNGGATVTERGIVWATTASPTTSNNKVTNGSGDGTFSGTVSSLPSNSTIHFRAYAINSAGTSYGSDLTFNTLAPAPVINSALTASGTFGTAISTYTITATNTPTSYGATGLPPGLSINTGNGQITGTPSTPIGSPFSTTITATNGGGTDTKTLVFTVNKAVLTISGITGNNKIYNGTTTATVNFVSPALNGVVAGSLDVQATAGGLNPNFADRNVGTGKTITVSGLALQGTDAPKYTLTDPTVTGDITAKALTITGLTAGPKVYDGTANAPLTGTAALQGTEAAGAGTTSDGKPYTVDGVSLTGTVTSTFADKNIGTARPITVGGLSLTGSGNTNYTLTPLTTLSANVTAKPLAISGLTAGAKTYDGTTNVALTGTAALGAAETAGTGTASDGLPYTGDTVNLSGTAAGVFADRNAGTGKTVTITGLSINNSNYSLTGTLTADITAKALTVSGLSAVASRVYDGTLVAGLTGTPSLQATETAGSGTTSDGIPYDVDAVSLTGTAAGAFADRNIGTAKAISLTGLSLTGTGNSNYTLTAPGLTADVTTKALTVSGVTAVATRVYDGTLVAALTGTAAIQGTEAAGAGDTSDGKPYAVDAVTLTGTAAGVFGSKDVGTAKAITVSGLSVTGTGSTNYTVTQPTGLSADVTTKALAVSGLSAVATRIYDGTVTAGLSGTAALLSTEAAGAGDTSDGKPYAVDAVTISGTAAGVFGSKDIGTAKAITVSGLSVTGTGNTNYTVTQPVGLTANVTTKALTVSGLSAVASRVYNGTLVAGLTGTAAIQATEAAGAGDTSDGKPYAVDAVTLTGTAAGAFGSKDVGTAKAITVTGLSVTGTGNANYTVTQPTGLSGDVTTKALTISGVTAVSTRIYDGTTVAGLSGTAAFLASETAGTGTTSDGQPYTGDAITMTGTAAGAFADRHVGTAKAITVSGLSIGGGDAANYTLTPLTGFTADVTTKALAVNGVSAVASRVYDGTNVAGLTGTAAFSAAETAGTGATNDGKPYTGDAITIGGTAAGTFADRNVGTAKAITVTGVTVTGTDSGNYTVTQPTGLTGNVTAKALTIAGVTASDKIYDATLTAPLGGTAAFLTAGAAGSGTTSDGAPYTVDTINVGGAAAGAFADKDVGTAKAITVTGITVAGLDNGNYTPTQPTGLTAAITKKNLSISGVNAANKVYNGTTSVVLSGSPTLQAAEAPGDGTTADGKPYTGDTFNAGGVINGTFADRHVGTGKTITITGVSLSGAQSGNYAVGTITATADITPKALSISGVSAVATRVYDGTLVAGLTGTPALATAEATGTGTTVDGIPYTVDTIALGGTAAGAFADRHVGTAKGITVTGITLTGTDNANYTVTQPTGLSGDVTAKALTVAGVTAVPTRVYDTTLTAGLTGTAAFLTAEAAGTGTTTDGVPYSGDAITIGGTAAGTFATKTVGTAKPITVTGVTVTGTDNANYTVTQPTGLTADVTAAGLTISGVTANNKTYDGNLVATLNTGGAALVTVIGSDTVTLVSGSATGSFGSKTVGTGKPVTTAGFSLGGADAGNYSLTQPATTANITAKTITVGGITVANKTYDGNTTGTPTYTGASFTGVVPGDTVTLVSSGGTATFNSKVVATGKTVTFAGLTLAGVDATNYTLTQPTTTANITVKAVTVTGITANSRGYNGSTAATLNTGAAAVIGIVGGDAATLVTSGAVGTFSDANAGLSKTVQVSGLTLTGSDATNYTVTQPSTTAGITPAGVSIVISNLSFVYDGTPKPATITISPNVAATTVYSGGGSAPVNAGTYTVSVNVTDGNYSGSGTATLTIARATQTVDFTIAGSDYKVGTGYGLTATSTSGGPIAYAVVNGSASIAGSTVTPSAAGTVTLRASQAGTDNYLPASTERVITVTTSAKANQTITFASLADVAADVGGFAVSATASSGLPVSFTIVSGPATISAGGSLTLSGQLGVVTVRASQSGNAVYNAATDVLRSFSVVEPAPDVFFGDVADDANPGPDGRGELIAAGGPRLDAKQGDVAAALFPGTNRGVVAIVAPALNLNVAVDFVLGAGNTYSATFTSGGRALTLTGSLAGGRLTGRVSTLNIGFSTPAQARTGTTRGLAGIYEADAVNSASGGTTTIVSATGRVLVVSNIGTTSTGAVGTIAADGTFSLTGTGVTIAGSVDTPTSTVNGTVTFAGQSPVSFTTLSALAPHTDRVINLSSRVGISPTRTLITGFVIGGTGAKRVLIRGIGPGLTGFGVAGALVNPRLSLFDAAGKVLLENDDWSGTETSAAFAQVGAFALPSGSKDCALLTTLSPGAYTVQITAGAETGTALAEIYDASANAGTEPQRLVNISTRGTVDTGAEGLLIGGFVVTGNVPKKVLIRGVGPALAGFGVAGALVDPTLAVYNSKSELIAQNNDWQTPAPLNAQQATATAAEITAAAQSVGAFALGAGGKDAALIITLAPGAYTAQVSGAAGTAGTALVEIYELP